MGEVQQVDVVVVGLGVGGEEVAGRLAEAGLAVVGVEHTLVGGECPYWGCIPTKMMIRAGNALAEARRIPGLAGASTVQPDWSPVAKRIRDEATDTWDDKVAADRFTGKGGRFVRGRATIVGQAGSRSRTSSTRPAAVSSSRPEPPRSSRRSRVPPARRSGPTAKQSRPRTSPAPCWYSAGARSDSSCHRSWPGSGSRSRSSKAATDCSRWRNRSPPRSLRRRSPGKV